MRKRRKMEKDSAVRLRMLDTKIATPVSKRINMVS